jgi:hypothetical protein
VKKSRFGLFGPVLYNEKNLYRAAATAKALSERFTRNLLPPGFTDPVLSAFANAIFHRSTCAEVAVTLNETSEPASAAKAQARPALRQYASIPKHLRLTTKISVWAKIMGLLRSWEPADLLQEEQLENLKAIIGGTLKSAITNPPSR